MNDGRLPHGDDRQRVDIGTDRGRTRVREQGLLADSGQEETAPEPPDPGHRVPCATPGRQSPNGIVQAANRVAVHGEPAPQRHSRRRHPPRKDAPEGVAGRKAAGQPGNVAGQACFRRPKSSTSVPAVGTADHGRGGGRQDARQGVASSLGPTWIDDPGPQNSRGHGGQPGRRVPDRMKICRPTRGRRVPNWNAVAWSQGEKERRGPCWFP